MLVKVEFWIQSITAVDEVTNDFEVEMYINELWLDPKLRFDHLSACRSNLSLDQAVLDRIWSPQSSFVNTKSAEILDSPFPNVFLTLFENGTVWVNYVRAADLEREKPYSEDTCNWSLFDGSGRLPDGQPVLSPQLPELQLQ